MCAYGPKRCATSYQLHTVLQSKYKSMKDDDDRHTIAWVILPGEFSHSFQKPRGVAVKRHRCITHGILSSVVRYCTPSSGFNLDQTHVCEFTLDDTFGHPAASWDQQLKHNQTRCQLVSSRHCP